MGEKVFFREGRAGLSDIGGGRRDEMYLLEDGTEGAFPDFSRRVGA